MNLFEYQNKEKFEGDLNELESFLDEIWVNRDNANSKSKDNSLGQRFIDVNHRKGLIKAQNYVGVVQFNDQTLNLLPKIFYEEGKSNNPEKLKDIQQHLFWWLGYCRKIKFPKYLSNSSSMKQNFFEVLIYHFASYTRSLLNNSIYQQYQEQTEETPFLRGRINTSNYLRENIGRGNWHKFNCTYDSFVVDNQFNRVIKYVARLLHKETKVQENKNLLYEILFFLDDVSDINVSSNDCRHLKFNSMMEEFEVVRDYCLLFLENSTVYDYKDNMRLFAFLLPMEYLFEDFLTGFISRELPQISFTAQSTKVKLDKERNYTLKPDLIFFEGNAKIIGDTKYKIINDPEKPVNQTDLYQMVSYAIRYKAERIFLFYPNTSASLACSDYMVEIKDELASMITSSEVKIVINAIQLPIIKDSKISFQQHANVLKDHLLKLLVD